MTRPADPKDVAAATAAACGTASLGVDAPSARTAVQDDGTGSAPSARKPKQAINTNLVDYKEKSLEPKAGKVRCNRRAR